MTSVSLPLTNEQMEDLVLQVASRHEPVVIDSDGHKAVLVSLEDFANLDTTAYLMSNPVNKQRLLEAIDQLNRGEGVEREIDLEA